MHHRNPTTASPESRGTTKTHDTPKESCLRLQCAMESDDLLFLE